VPRRLSFSGFVEMRCHARVVVVGRLGMDFGRPFVPGDAVNHDRRRHCLYWNSNDQQPGKCGGKASVHAPILIWQRPSATFARTGSWLPLFA